MTERIVVDVIPGELGLARAQLDAGLATVAEGTLLRRIARLETEGLAAADELDAAQLLLAEALWRQHRPLGARAALDGIRPVSSQRRLPIALLIEAEGLAASGEPDRAQGMLERVLTAVGADEAWRLRGGVPSRLPWPLPAELRPEQRHPDRPPWGPPSDLEPAADDPGGELRVAGARARIESARASYTAGDAARGDHELSLAVRLDAAVAGDGVALIEPTLGEGPEPERLLLYGDLLRAAGRDVEAQEAYDRAAGPES